jgi:hypothetical protein
MLRLKLAKEVGATLTDEQKTQLSERPGAVYNALFGGMGAGMGGPRRGGGGAGGGNQ